MKSAWKTRRKRDKYGNDDDKNKVEKEGKKSYPHQYFTRHVSESVSSGPRRWYCGDIYSTIESYKQQMRVFLY